MKFSVNFLTDPEEQTHGCWVTCSTHPTDIIEAAWADEEEPPKAMYPKGWTVQPYSHPDLDKALQFFWAAIQELGWPTIDPKILENLWFKGEPDLEE